MAVRAILTDIEGTTSSLSFVKDRLFPYAREHLAAFVRAHAREPAVRRELDEVSRLAGRALSDDDAIRQLIAWIDEDRKITPLKSLQGMIWEQGYRRGELKGHVHEDAVRQMRRWKSEGLALYVYSSGSVLAQKLLFGYSTHGDLTPLFSGYFDTNVGPKRETAAYQAIVHAIGLPPGEILFLSDIPEELDAARAAGLRTCLLTRDGETSASAAAANHPRAQSFDEIRL
ncbi:MAG: 2,3-diketo-5-methylthio-1-phosphopentane phosphatase [Candidatus Muproteobacteria bacterium RBG_16_62_13]|uniref:Enolase-phosphatase E1 n=1 Tax=Candidatus Muproteobacteria bacterium RBG_16_62_13 TaxID=1817756 RepID=A0A1F6T384_9PROT|nr:MAG: 2,3-diketo-5-methylthio-1-phosphopentane phosphatase [Candidatus Muproteobacteria bacterium RBG_16_62_13]